MYSDLHELNRLSRKVRTIRKATHSVLHRITTELSTLLWKAGETDAAIGVWDRQLAFATQRDADGMYAADLHHRAGYWLQWRQSGTRWAYTVDPLIKEKMEAFYLTGAELARRSEKIGIHHELRIRHTGANRLPAPERARMLGELVELAEAWAAERGRVPEALPLLWQQYGDPRRMEHTGLTREQCNVYMRRALWREPGIDPTRPLMDPEHAQHEMRTWVGWCYIVATERDGDMEEVDRAYRHLLWTLQRDVGPASPLLATYAQRYIKFRKRQGDEPTPEEVAARVSSWVDLDALAANADGPIHPIWASDRLVSAAGLLDMAGRTDDALRMYERALEIAEQRGEAEGTIAARRKSLERYTAKHAGAEASS